MSIIQATKPRGRTSMIAVFALADGRGERVGPDAGAGGAETVARNLWIRDARLRPELQPDPSELVRHHAPHQAAHGRGGVRQGRQHVRRRAPDAPRRALVDAHRSRRPDDDLRIRAVRRRRRRGPDDVPPAPRLRRARRVRRRPVPGARSWTSTCSRTRSSTGDRPAWRSSGTSRCAGCRSRAIRG